MLRSASWKTPLGQSGRTQPRGGGRTKFLNESVAVVAPGLQGVLGQGCAHPLGATAFRGFRFFVRLASPMRRRCRRVCIFAPLLGSTALWPLRLQHSGASDHFCSFSRALLCRAVQTRVSPLSLPRARAHYFPFRLSWAARLPRDVWMRRSERGRVGWSGVGRNREVCEGARSSEM